MNEGGPGKVIEMERKMEIKSYRDAGVDIERGEAFTEYIKNIRSPAVSPSIGGFAGGAEIDTTGYDHPVLLSTTDGVGTKILVARKLNDYSTIGIDLVAMCVNDLIVCNALPLSFLDYVACGRLNDRVLKSVMEGIVAGCEESGCLLSGGETAELPDMYGPEELDLAGFCTGIAEKKNLLPKSEEMREGDIVLGLPSAGIHSNGLTLARKTVPDSDRRAYESLLAPTKIYVREMKQLLAGGGVLGAAHITGGGLEANIRRILPEELTCSLHWNWEIPKIFDIIRQNGNIDEPEMRKVFNMGIGIAFITHPETVSALLKTAEERSIVILQIGELAYG